MKKMIGYMVAALSLVVAVATFLGTSYFSHKLVSATGLIIAPRYTGGETVRIIDHELYRTVQHRAVFDGLFGQQPEGFIQLDFAPLNSLPDKIIDDIDFDLDGRVDFRIEYDTSANRALIIPYDDRVMGLEGSYILRERRAIRVKLKNIRR